MGRIRLTPEVLIDGAQHLRKIEADNNDAITRLDSLINGLVSDWHGEAQEAFANSYQNKRAQFIQLSRDMEGLCSFLEVFAREMQEADHGVARRIRGERIWCPLP